MEFPYLGNHCHHSSCKQLDFLPIKCDSCDQIFCLEHMKYDAHDCPSSYKKNVQVPVCPLCNKPVPVDRNELPDIKVGEHIDRLCQSDPAVAKRQVYANRCSLKGCKQRELMPIKCSLCNLNYCLKHRHEQDHRCPMRGSASPSLSDAGLAAAQRQKASSQPSKPNTSRNHGTAAAAAAAAASSSNMSEDEALALAIQMSLNSGEPSHRPTTGAAEALSQEDEDRALALALQQSEREFARQQQVSQENRKKGCLLA